MKYSMWIKKNSSFLYIHFCTHCLKKQRVTVHVALKNVVYAYILFQILIRNVVVLSLTNNWCNLFTVCVSISKKIFSKEKGQWNDKRRMTKMKKKMTMNKWHQDYLTLINFLIVLCFQTEENNHRQYRRKKTKFSAKTFISLEAGKKKILIHKLKINCFNFHRCWWWGWRRRGGRCTWRGLWGTSRHLWYNSRWYL